MTSSTLKRLKVRVRRNPVMLAILGGFVIWGIVALCTEEFGSGEYGDAFGPMTGLATAVALIFAMSSLTLQRKELRAQRLELGLHRDEFHHQTLELRNQSKQTRKHVEEAQKTREVMANQSEHTHRLAEEFARSADLQQSLVEDSILRHIADRRLRYMTDLNDGLEGILKLIDSAETAAENDRQQREADWSEFETIIHGLTQGRDAILEEVDRVRADPNAGPSTEFDLSAHLRGARNSRRQLETQRKEMNRSTVHEVASPAKVTIEVVEEIIPSASEVHAQINNMQENGGHPMGALGLETERLELVELLEQSEEKLLELKAGPWRDQHFPSPGNYFDVAGKFEAIFRSRKALRDHKRHAVKTRRTPSHSQHPSEEQCHEFLEVAERLASRVHSLDAPENVTEDDFRAERQDILRGVFLCIDELRRVLDSYATNQPIHEVLIAAWLIKFREIERRAEALQGLR